jgi:hypothetical protein
MADRTPAPDRSLIDGWIDRADAVSARWNTVITVLSAAWFAASCADYAGFIDLPLELPLIGSLGVIPAIIWNVLWWGFAYPRITARRAERLNMENPDG